MSTFLLEADRVRLRHVAAALIPGGRFAVVVCSDALWPDAREVIAEVLDPSHRFEERAASDASEVFAALTAATRETPGTTTVLHVVVTPETLATLNHNRDALRRPPSNVVVRVGDVEAERALRFEAPDAWSFRDALAAVEGANDLPTLDDAADSLAAFEELGNVADDPRQRAHIWVQLGIRRLEENQLDGAREAFDIGIRAFESLGTLTLNDRNRLAQAYFNRGAALDEVGRHRYVARARAALEPVRDSLSPSYVRVVSTACDGLGYSLRGALEGVELTQWSPLLRAAALRPLVEARLARADVNRAATELEEALGSAAWLTQHERFLLGRSRRHVAWQKGLWTRVLSAEQQAIADASTAFQRQRAHRDYVRALLACCELPGAERILAELPETPELMLWRAEIARERDDATELSQLLGRATSLARDFEARLHAFASRAASDPLDPELEARASRLIADGAAREPDDPPWHELRARAAHADALAAARDPARAHAAADAGLALARTSEPLWIGRFLTRIIALKLLMGTFDGIADLIAEGRAAAAEAEDRGDEVRLAALALAYAHARCEPTADALATLRAALAASGSLTLAAAVLQQLGRLSGERTYLEESRALYRGFPCPSSEGEVLEALGAKPQARARYLDFGLKRRLRLLEEGIVPPIPLFASG